MSSVISLVKYSSCLCALAILFFPAANASAQSTDLAHPTPIVSFPVTGTLGTGTYYYSVPATAGSILAVLNFTPPDSGGGLSVAISGPDCCIGDAYVGADSGLSDPVRRESRFSVASPQTLLLLVYVSVAPRHTVRFDLTLSGSVGGSPAGSPLCTDLGFIDGFNLSVSADTRTISGEIRNLSSTDYSSPADRQVIEVFDIAKMHRVRGITGTLVRRIPFTDVPARGSLPFTARHTTASLLPPVYKVRIVYSPANRTDTVTTNDDCNPSNNETLRYPVALP